MLASKPFSLSPSNPFSGLSTPAITPRANRRIMISYDSNLTGSKDLRCDNIDNVWGIIKGKPTENLSEIGKYAAEYDKVGKNTEPLYDGYLACIALLNDDKFDESFKYIEVEYADEGQNDDPRVSRLSTCVVSLNLGVENINGDVEGEYNRMKLNYSSAKHVFLMSPFTQACVDYIRSLENEEGTIIFHVQGEATCKSDTKKSTVEYPNQMTSHPNLFPLGFNLWTGEAQAFDVRQMMNERYTVKLKPGIPRDQLQLTDNRDKTKKFDASIPKIMVSMRNYMINACLLKSVSNTVELEFAKLNISAIFQDMIDKDNLVSCWVLMKNSMSSPKLSLVGRRVYDCNFSAELIYNPFDERAKAIGYKGDGKYLMSSFNEIQYPVAVIKAEGVDTPSPNTKFDVNGTLNNHASAKISFINALKLSGIQEIDVHEVDSKLEIADGVGETAISRRAPFSEKMFTMVSFMKEAIKNAVDKRRKLIQQGFLFDKLYSEAAAYHGGSKLKSMKKKRTKRIKRIKTKRIKTKRIKTKRRR